MIDPVSNRRAQDGYCQVTVLRWTEDSRAGELHGAKAHSLHVSVSEPEYARGTNVTHGKSPRIIGIAIRTSRIWTLPVNAGNRLFRSIPSTEAIGVFPALA